MAAELERLSPEDCVSTYETTFQSKYASVVLISDAFDGNTDVPAADTAVIYVDTARVPGAGEYIDTVPYHWICDDKLDGLYYDYNCADRVGNVKSGDEWVVGGYKIDYCLAERTAEKCTLEYSLPLAIIVICVNFVKALLICLAPSLLGDGPLLTIGDGIGSFLRRPDETTEGNCLLTREVVARRNGQDSRAQCQSRVQKATRYCVRGLRGIGVPVSDKLDGWAYSAGPTKEPDESEIKPLRYSVMPKRRWTSLSRARWVTCLLTCAPQLPS
jgi:hypothetical protein